MQHVLTCNELSLEKDISVFEIHEASAGQILSNLTTMASQQKFADEKIEGIKVGVVDHNKLNTKGGSLALGHPFGAMRSRLVMTVLQHLQQEEEHFALVAACADGGMGHVCILE